ncbi:hypothetical protein BEL04_00900 [Mucilaginibacter sp. PPCGB 2223]|uniref:hypothetical protein n=1 Tax=Mucilaginibacter sp. PPCGB 2223 TaxID=1886027 RepID=UPI000826A83A|nr:hypothetical protein [Mucilaginibacter sp. PPCGB 2223]OCX52917.1 hypothetical protein BEL04_00900 [Mucilaginibacter sp. PPCGB 2223]
MATNQFKKIREQQTDPAELRRHNRSVMMPFIRFGAGAMKLIAQTLIRIVKHIPKPGHHESKSGNKAIKL